MKVCHLTSAHDSYDTRIFQKECISLAERGGLEVFLVAPGKSRREKGVTVIGVGDKPENRLKRMTTFTHEVYKAAVSVNAELYHFHDPELLPIGMKLKKDGKIVVFDSHENTYLQIKVKPYLPVIVRKIVAACYLKYEKHVCRHIDAVIYTENNNPFKGIAKKTIIIDNLPIVEEFTPEETSVKKYDVCCTGSLTKERGITVLLEASQKMNAKVVLAGEFSSEEYKSELEQSGLLQNVDFKGYCSLREVKKILAETKIAVSNIRWIGQYFLCDNLPTKVYEAMAMEVPVILSDFPHYKKMVNKYGFGVCVNPDNPEDLAQKISFLLSDDKLRLEMGKKGRKLIEEQFSWEKERMKLFELYDILKHEGNSLCI